MAYYHAWFCWRSGVAGMWLANTTQMLPIMTTIGFQSPTFGGPDPSQWTYYRGA